MQARHQFGKQRLVRAAMAEILADGIDQHLALAAQQLAQAFQPLLTLRKRRERMSGVGLALHVEQGMKIALQG